MRRFWEKMNPNELIVMLISLPADLLRKIIITPRMCTNVSMCSTAAREIMVPLMVWSIDGVPGPRRIAYGFKSVSATVCGRVYSIRRISGDHLEVEYDGRYAHTVRSAGFDSNPTELAVHFPVVGDVSLREAIHEILGEDKWRNFNTRCVKRLYDITGSSLPEYTTHRKFQHFSQTFAVEICDNTFVGEPVEYKIIVRRDQINIHFNGTEVQFTHISYPVIDWLKPYVVEGLALYPEKMDHRGDKDRAFGIAVGILANYFHVLTSDDRKN